METNIKFETDLDSWILIPTIGVARYNSNKIAIGIAFLCFSITINS